MVLVLRPYPFGASLKPYNWPTGMGQWPTLIKGTSFDVFRADLINVGGLSNKCQLQISFGKGSWKY